MSSSKEFYAKSPLFTFVNTKAFIADVNAIPSRKAAIDKMSEKCRKAIERISEAYVKEARRIMKDVPAAYCRMAGYIGILNKDNVFVQIPEMVPVVTIRNLSVDIFDNGTKTLLNFDSDMLYPDDKAATLVPKLVEDRGVTQLISYMKDLRETKDIRISNNSVYIPRVQGIDENEETQAIQEIVDRHLLQAEQGIKSWLQELGQYADPGGLFGAML